MTPEQRITELERKIKRLERVMKVDANALTFSVPVTFKKTIKVGGATIYTGYGSPENVQAGVIGSLYLALDGTSSATLYVKESGSGVTGWSTTA